MKTLARTLAALCLVALGLLAPFAIAAYDYPVADGFVASIVGTPLELQAPLPEEIPLRTRRLPGSGEVPGLFWHQQGLEFSFAKQRGGAPVAFLVAGTGAGHDSAKMKGLARALYGAGFHVVCFSSSTYLNFIVNASSSKLPGFLPDDTRDLYRVMEQAWATLEDEIDAEGFVIAGYSLGGISAAFLARHDESARRFGFSRVLMINPPVDLYSSARLLDSYLEDNVSVRQGGSFLDEVIERIAIAYQPKHGMRLDEDFLYRAYGMLRAEGRPARSLARNPEQALVGLSFRLSSSAMVFAGDVMTRSGYIAPKDKAFGDSESLEYYAWASAQVPFVQYVDELLLPTVMKERPGATREQLLREASLHGIETWLRGNPRVFALSNADEIILAPGELDYMRSVLAERLRVYPRGGHCGNILHRDTVRDIVTVLRGGSLPAGGAGA
jgi:hypothetical protein